MRVPQPRGPMSSALFSALRDEEDPPRLVLTDDDDLQISLWALYELHYRGFDDVDPRKEWDPETLGLRAALELVFETRLREQAAPLVLNLEVVAAGDVTAQLQVLAQQPGPSLAGYLQRQATTDQYLEFLKTRSLYHLKEADPHTWALPRLTGRAKAALVEIQYDEYGGGRTERIHQNLFADALRGADLDPTYGAYVDQVPSETLAVNNAMSLFGLHRRLRGAAMGHLAAFEMTSSLPCRRFARGAERLGLDSAVVAYFEEHVEADAVHEQIASRDLAGSLVSDEPELADDVLLGAAACVQLDAAVAVSTLAAWERGGSSLRPHEIGRRAS